MNFAPTLESFFIDSTSLLISLGSPKPLITTLAPLLARAFATDSPIPDVEPVTMADLPARKLDCGSSVDLQVHPSIFTQLLQSCLELSSGVHEHYYIALLMSDGV